MSMPYKVYVFEYDRFYEELADILFRALTSNSEEELRSFIDQHFEILKHPYEGTPLESSWETEFAPISVQMLAEICLTKYFDPSDDHGLVYWIGLDDVLNSIEEDLGEIILGHS